MSVDLATSHNGFSNERRAASGAADGSNMKYTFGPKPKTAQMRPHKKTRASATARNSPPDRKNRPSGSIRPQPGDPQNAERNYQRYLALARAEALAGDRIAAENYFQHAEHYFRSMAKNNPSSSAPQPVTPQQ
jgi:hypothetical protein